MSNLSFQQIQVGTPAYEEMVKLRLNVLLDPVGVPRSYINSQNEKLDYLLGLYQDDQLLACCILTPKTKDLVQLRQMAVDFTSQKTGLGKALLSHAETLAKTEGYQTLMMHARDAVITFYEKCGYNISGDAFVEVGIGHHPMQKAL